MKRAATTLVAAAAIAACDPAPQGGQPTTASAPPTTSTQQSEPGSYTIHVTVSGPQDTLMRVAREGQQSQVALEGEPFDYELTETEQAPGELGIGVFAKTEDPSREPVRCSITVNGETVAEDSADTLNDGGIAEVACTIPEAT